MPIKPEKKKLYPPNWAQISLLIRQQAGWKCELCKSAQNKPQIVTGGIVILTVHHINGDPTDNRRINLIALCQCCHNRLDQPFRHKPKERGVLFDDLWKEGMKPELKGDIMTDVILKKREETRGPVCQL